MLSIRPISCLADNYIWVLQHGCSVIAVDPGEAPPLLDYLQQNRLELTAVLLTHRHADHVGGLPEICAAHAPAVYGPASIAGVTHPLRGGEQVRLLETDWQVIAVPGHTDEHLAYYGAGALFCGDVLFGAGCGRVFDGTPQQLHASLNKLTALPADTQVYSAHEYTLANLRFAAAVEPGNPAISQRTENERRKREQQQPTLPSTLALELATNPFLRCAAPTVIRSVHERAPEASSPEEVFTVLREWKNHFK